MRKPRATNIILYIQPEKRERILLLRAQGMTVRAIAADVGINKSSVGRFLKEQEFEGVGAGA